jgi:hypothetical protein
MEVTCIMYLNQFILQGEVLHWLCAPSLAGTTDALGGFHHQGMRSIAELDFPGGLHCNQASEQPEI